MSSPTTPRKRFRISVAGAVVVAILLVLTDWTAGGWRVFLGMFLVVVLVGNLWGAWVAWRAMRGGSDDGAR